MDQPRTTLTKPSPTLIAICGGLVTLLAVGGVLSSVIIADVVGSDDRFVVYESAGAWTWSWQAAREAFRRVLEPAGTGGHYQPLVQLSYMLDAQLTGDSEARAFVFHLHNLALHLLNVALVFGLVRRLSGSVVWSIALALLFGLHPVQVESVAWVAQRQTLLATAFALGALCCHLRYGRTGGVIWLPVVMLLYLGSVLSKPTFVALPLALLLLDIWPLRRLDARCVMEKAPLLLTMIAVAGLQLWIQSGGDRTASLGAPVLAAAVRNVSSFIQRLVWPFALSPVYPVAGAGPTAGFGDWAVVVLAGGGMLLSARGLRPLFVALGGAAVMTVPALVNLPFSAGLLGDQHLYAALIVPIIATAAWIAGRPVSQRRFDNAAAGVAVAAVALVFGVASRNQTRVWHNGETFFTRIVQTHPTWIPGYAGLVDWHLRRGQPDALTWSRRAVAADASSPLAQFCLGTALLADSDRTQEAIEPLRRALSSRPDWAACRQNLGTALARTGRIREALPHLERARDLDPRSSDIRIGLGYAYLELDRPGEARRELQLALKRRNDPLVHMGLAMAWAQNDNLDYAVRHLRTAVARDHRIAARAARTPALQRLTDRPEFADMIRSSGEAASPGRPSAWEMPTAGTGGA